MFTIKLTVNVVYERETERAKPQQSSHGNGA